MQKIAIHSVPRSGSSWLGQIFNSAPTVNFKFQPLFSYAFKNYLNSSSNKVQIDKFFENIEKSQDEFLLQKDNVNKGIYPVFNKEKTTTHIIYKEVRYHNILENMLAVHPDIKVIGLVRNPFSVINSFLNSPREFRKDLGWNEFEEWRKARKKNKGLVEEYFGYDKWKEVLFLFKKLQNMYPDNFYFIKYESLLRNTEYEVSKLFTFCELAMTEQTREFILDSRSNNRGDVYSVFKNKKFDNKWKTTLPIEIIDEIKYDLMKNNLEEYLR